MSPSRCRVCGSEIPADDAARCSSCGTDRPTHWPCAQCGYDLGGSRPRWGLATCPECGLENASGLPPRGFDTGWFRRAGIVLAALMVLMLVPPVGFVVLGLVLLVVLAYAAVLVWRKGWSGVWSSRDEARR